MGCAKHSKFTINPLDLRLLDSSLAANKMIIKNPQKIPIPEHLNAEFFVKVMEEGLREALVNLHEINFEWGSNPGENYCSNIYRVQVTYDLGTANKLETCSLILKTIPITTTNQFLNDIGVFMKEKIAFMDILPKLEVLSKGDKFAANYFYSITKPMQTIVFNDLKVEGFAIAERQQGLDWHHASLVLGQLGKLHATSMVLAQKMPAIRKRFQKGIFCTETALKSKTFRQMFSGFLDHVIKLTSQWPGYQRISEHLRRYQRGFGEITATLAVAKPGDRYTVLNHGDLWTNNFMFAYDNPKTPKKPTKLLFVDFQVSFFGSPACDVNFFLNTSLSYETLVKHRHDLIQHYYNVFRETLIYLRYDSIPSMEDFKYELRSREALGLFGLFGFLPIVTIPKDASVDSSIENFSNEEHQKKKLETMFSNPNLIDHLKYGLRRYEEIGVFNDF